MYQPTTSVPTITYPSPHNRPEHLCTAGTDALTPDEPGAYVGRHRADMAVLVGNQLVDELVTLSWSPAQIIEGAAAACGSFLAFVSFTVTHGGECRCNYIARRVARYAEQGQP